MKKIFVLASFVICILTCVACGKNENVNTDVQETTEGKIKTSDFNSEMNQTIIWGEYQFEIPQDWKCEFDETEAGVYLYPDKEQPPIFTIGTVDTPEKYDFSEPTIQEQVAKALAKSYATQIGDCNLLNYEVPMTYLESNDGSKMDVTGRYELYIGCNGTMNEKSYTGYAIAFYLRDILYNFCLFQYDDSKYDFFDDLCDIAGSIKLADDMSTDESNESGSDIKDAALEATNEELEQIEVTFVKDYVDGERLHLKVYVKNNSSKSFTGDVHLFFYSRDGVDRLGSDMIIVEDLAPGRESWSNVTKDKYNDTPKLELEFTNPIFTEVEEIVAEIDKDATEKTQNSYKLNFEGVSWYTDITDIVVYDDGSCVVTIVNDSKENGQFYASTVWQCGSDYGVDTVQVVDSDGNIKSVYP